MATLSQSWKDTVDKGITDRRWNEHDLTIKKAVDEYNARLGKVSRYVEKPMLKLDWKWIKIIIWVESGGPEHPSNAWKTRPMQIGNTGDLAYAVLQNGEEASAIIMSQVLKDSLARINTPEINIKAGIAYLLNRLSISTIKSIKSATDKCIYEYQIDPGDTLNSIAQWVDTTDDELKSMNPRIDPKRIQLGTKLFYRKASMERVITGWKAVSAQTIAENYNGGGDPKYAAKLTYVKTGVFPKTRRTNKSSRRGG